MKQKKRSAQHKMKTDSLLKIYSREEWEKRGKLEAEFNLTPAVQSSFSIEALSKKAPAIMTPIMDELQEQAQRVIGNDLSRLEAMLVCQAHTLDSLFNQFIQKMPETPMAEHQKFLMTYALRAQNQCRATIETLAELKNPRPYIQQQNMAANNMQINNDQGRTNINMDEVPAAPAHKKIEKSSNKLLEDKRHEGEWLDAGASQAAIGNDKAMEAVEKVDRPKVRIRERSR